MTSEIGIDDAVRYLKNIRSDEPVLVVHHWDMDGSAAAAIVSRVLDTVRGQPADRVVLPKDRKHRVGERVEQFIDEADIEHLIVVDMGVAPARVDELVDLGVDMLVVDHHTFESVPDNAVFVNPRIVDEEAYVPAAKLCNDIAARFDLDLDWIAGMGVIQDFAVAGHEDLFERLRDAFPHYFPDELSQQKLAKECRYGTYSSVLNIKPYKDSDRCAELAHNALTSAGTLKELEMQEAYQTLADYQQEMMREIERVLERFDEEKEVFEDEQLIFFRFDSDYHINSSIATQISLDREDWAHVIVNTHHGTANVSARCQSGRLDLGALLQEAMPENVAGEAGGHRKAAGASFPSDHVDSFQDNLLQVL